VLRNNHIHHQRQQGLGAKGSNSLVEGNEISFCNYNDEYDPGWSAGGSKFWETRNFTIRNNYVHHNHGPGLWDDNKNDNIVYEGNICEDNMQSGIFHEIGYKTTIRCNFSRYNGRLGRHHVGWLYDAQILISSCGPAEISHNTVVVGDSGGNAITFIQQNRHSSQFMSDNIRIHHNHITYRGNEGLTGGAADWNEDWFYNQSNNIIDSNSYHAADSGASKHWHWKWGTTDWKGFRDFGFEAGGTIDTDVGPGTVMICGECVELLSNNRFVKTIIGDVTALRAPKYGNKERARIEISPRRHIALTFAGSSYERIELFSVSGRHILRAGMSSSRRFLLPRGLPAGTYLVRAVGSKGAVMQQKIAISR
jgi:hypothetical protein